MARTREPFPFRMAPFFIMQYACNAIYQNNISNYLRSAQMSDSAIGYLLTLTPLAGMLGQLIFGRLGDRVRYKNTLLIALGVLSAASIFLTGLSAAVSVMLLSSLLCVYSFFQMSSEPLMNAIALETLDRRGLSFGPIRSLGTASFALVSPLVGMLIVNQYPRMIPIATIALVLLAASAILLPKVEGHAHRNPRAGSIAPLLKNKTLVTLVLTFAGIMIGFSVFYTFYPIHFTSEAIGGTSTMLGWGFFISSAIEVPVLLNSDKIFKKLGASRILATAGGVLALRLFLLSSLVNPYALLATQALHGWGLALMSFAMAKYINLVVPMELKASGQMLFTLAAMTLPRSLGSLIGGALRNWVDLSSVFLLACLFVAAVSAVFCVIIRRDKELLAAGSGEPEPA